MSPQRTFTLVFILALATTCLPACVTTHKTPEAVASKMTSNRDDYNKSTTLQTPRYYKPSDKGLFANEIGHDAYLRCYLFDKSGTYSIVLRVVYSGQAWAFLDRATDSNGVVLPTTSVSRDVVTGNLLRESLNIDLTKSYLQSHSETGFDIKVWGNRGSMILKYPPQYIKGFLESIEPQISAYRESN